MATGYQGTRGRAGYDQPRVYLLPYPSRIVNGCQQRNTAHAEKHDPLKNTQGTGVKVVNVLVVQAQNQAVMHNKKQQTNSIFWA